MKSSWFVSFIVTLIAFLAGIGATYTSAVKKLDNSFLDMMMITEKSEHESHSVVVAVDQYSLSIFGWPVDKSLYGAMISVLHEAGAKKIGFDLFFTDRKEENDPEALQRMIESEELLGVVAAETGTILGSFINRDFRNDESKITGYPETPKKAKTECPCIDSDKYEILDGKFSFLEKLVPGISKFNPEIAHVHVIPSDIDRVNRSIIGCKRVFDGCVKDLAMAVTGTDPYPECCKEEIIPYFRNASQFDVISMADVINASESEEKMAALKKRIDNKYVFVGATDQTLKDVGPTPSGLVEPLVFLHANRAEALLDGIKIRTFPQWIFFAVSFLICSLLVYFFNHARWFMISGSAAVPFVYGASYLLFRHSFVNLPPLELALPFIFANFAVAGYFGWKYFLFNQVLSNAFDNYVSPEILSWLKETGGKVLQSDSAERREITILFSDIAGYTSLSNSLNAENIMKSLRLYLDAMMLITAEHNGYVDKINGDGLMILFGAPKPFKDHAKKAFECAQAMQKKVHDMQDEWMKVTERELKIRIGMATDTVFVGNLGGAGHIEYSAIGRGVNFAARLESKSEIGGILISEETVKAMGKRPEGYKRSVELKGYTGEVDVWQIPPVNYETES